MKLIIDIPDYDYKQIKEVCEKSDIVESTYSYIYHGIPLDDVKAEIAKIEIPKDVKTVDGCFAFCQALEIADLAIDRVVDKHIGKAENKNKEFGLLNQSLEDVIDCS